jgi:hypothetical protein
MRRLFKELVLHLGTRVASVVMSFLMFSLIARRFPTALIQPVFYFGFTLGFVLATLRMILVLSAGLVSTESRTRRLRNAHRGYRHALAAYALTLPFWSYLLWRYSGSPLLTLGTALAVLPATFDNDLVRSIFARFFMFSLTFATGAFLSLAFVWFWPHHTTATLCLAFTLQWLPVGLFNLSIARRIRKYLLPSGRASLLRDLGHLPGIVLLSVFDGAVLNAPFITLVSLSPQVGIELSVITRIFVAALPMLPLLMHWANSGALAALARRLRIREPLAFTLILIASGTAAGTLFLLVFRIVSHLAVARQTFLLFLFLLSAYATYAAEMRFSGVALAPKQRIAILGATLAVFLLLFRAAASFSGGHALALVLVQSVALLVAALGLNRARPRIESSAG